MTVQASAEELVLTSYADVKDALASADLTRNIDEERFNKGNILDRVIMMLDGAEHRDRRRVENSLFRMDRLLLYEKDLFPTEIDQTLDRLLDAGAADLVDISVLLSMSLSARTAGVDFDRDSLEQRRVLRELTHRVALGAAIDAATGDIQEVKRDVRDALESLRTNFIGPSREVRRRMVDDVRAGRASEESLPRDLLTLLLVNEAELGMDDDTVVRETAFFLESGVISSSQTLTNSLNFMFDWGKEHPVEWEQLRHDRAFIQKCVHESIRLRPNNPAIKRRALRATQIGSTQVPEGQQLILDTASANRDRSIFGSDAQAFNPNRVVPASAARYGHGFGGGIHACIGRVLAVGLPIRFDSPAPDTHQFGLVTLAAEALIERGVSPHPSSEPVLEQETKRWTRWSSYPVAFHRRIADS